MLLIHTYNSGQSMHAYAPFKFYKRPSIFKISLVTIRSFNGALSPFCTRNRPGNKASRMCYKVN